MLFLPNKNIKGLHKTTPLIIANTAPIDNTKWKCPTTKYVSCKTRSRLLLLRVIPVKPPSVKRKRNPETHRTTGVIFILLPKIVEIQEKILIPVGIAIIIVAEVK